MVKIPEPENVPVDEPEEESSDEFEHNPDDDDEEFQRRRLVYSIRMRRLYRRIDVSMRHIESLKQNIRRAERSRTEGSGTEPPTNAEVTAEDKIRDMRREVEEAEQKLKRLIRTFQRVENRY